MLTDLVDDGPLLRWTKTYNISAASICHAIEREAPLRFDKRLVVEPS